MTEIYVSIRNKYRLLARVVRWGLLVLFLGVVGYQLLFYNNITTIFNEFLSSFRERHTSYLCWAIGLMPFNLLFETLKWQEWNRFFLKMSHRQAFRAVLAGLSLAIVTPNRVGEYGGRVWLLAPAQRGYAAVSMLLGSYCQWMVLFSGGVVGFCWFAFNYLHWQLYLIWIIIATGAFISLVLLLLFWQIGRILPIIRKCGFKRGRRSWLRYVVVLRAVTTGARLRALQWATLRYVTYSGQYWLLLQFFGIKVNVLEGFAGIASIFLIQTGVPLSAGLALLARGEIAVWVWGHWGANELGVLAATFGLFVINLILPALLGAMILVQKH